VIAAGTPEQVAATPESHTGRFLVELLEPSGQQARPARTRRPARSRVASAA
jgi:excinuclease ABC subunit A